MIAQQATLATRRAKSHDGETRERAARPLGRAVRATIARRAGASRPRRARPRPGGRGRPPSSRRATSSTAPWPRSADSRAAWTRSDLMRAVSDALPGHLRHRRRTEVAPAAGGADRRRARPGRPARRRGRDTDRRCRTSCCWPTGESAVRARPGRRRYATAGQLRRRARAARGGRARAAPPTLRRRGAERLLDRFAASGSDARRRPGRRAARRAHLRRAGRGAVRRAGHRQVVRRRRAGRRLDRRRRRGGCSGSPRPRSPPTCSPRRASPPRQHRRVARRAAPPRRAPAPAAGDDESVAAARAATWWSSTRPNMAGTDAPRRDPAALRRRGAKLLLVGDPRQLAAVGPGGALADVAERGAALRARRGPPLHQRLGARGVAAAARRRPAVLAEYAKHGRLRRRRHRRAGRGRRGARLARRHPRRPGVAADGRHQRRRGPGLRRSCAPSWSRSAGSSEHGRRRSDAPAGRAWSPGSATSCRPAATAGTSPAATATPRPRSTARPTASPRSAPTAGSPSPRSSPRERRTGEELGDAAAAARLLRRRRPHARLRLHRARRRGPHGRHRPRRGRPGHRPAPGCWCR